MYDQMAPSLGETADAIRETTARFSADVIAPMAAKIDADNAFPRALWPQMGALGLHGITVEEEYGGLGLGYLEHVVAVEEVTLLVLTAVSLLSVVGEVQVPHLAQEDLMAAAGPHVQPELTAR